MKMKLVEVKMDKGGNGVKMVQVKLGRGENSQGENGSG